MSRFFLRFGNLILLSVGMVVVFAARALLAGTFPFIRSGDLFTVITLVGALVVLIRDHRTLRPVDWAIAVCLGGLIGVGLVFASLFTPYPFLGLALGPWRALLRGLGVALAVLGGLVIMRKGGPVLFHSANGSWRKAGNGVWVGLVAGLPLALLNVLALQFTQGRALDWQNPLAAMVDAIQPGFVEEIIYRFALLGLVWLALRKRLPDQAGWAAGLLVLLAHNFMHYDDLFLQAPLTAIGMGLVMGLIWGLPLTYLALRKGLDSAIGFHWLQDAARFVAGF